MFDYWMNAAPTLAARMGVDPNEMVRAHAFLCETLGSDWIDTHCKNSKSSGVGSIADVHPLTLALKGATEECIRDVLRVASYLRTFGGDANISDAISSLRDADKCEPTLFELAVAWGFHNAGSSVTLFPATAKGYADCAVTIDGREYVIETSGFPSDSLRTREISFMEAMNRSLVTASGKMGLSFPMLLEIDVDDLDGKDRTSAFFAVSEAIRTFAEGDDPTQTVERTFEYGRAVLRRAEVGENPPRDSSSCAMRTNFGHITRVRNLDDDDDPYARLRKKLQREAKQLSGCKDGVIVLDIEALGVGVINDRGRLQELAAEFARIHRSTTGLAFTVLAYHMSGHRGLSGHYFPLAPTALPESFFQKVLSRDEGAGLFDAIASNVGPQEQT